MMSPAMKALYTYLWNTGNALSNSCLLVEDVVALYSRCLHYLRSPIYEIGCERPQRKDTINSRKRK